MCECNKRHMGWKGWLALPESQPATPSGPWVDISHVITETLSRSPVFPQPRISQIMRLPDQIANVTEIHMVCHHGTHVDAPRHFLNDGPAFQEIPLDRLCGPGVIWSIPKPALAVITPEDLEAATPAVAPGDIVILNTGWWKHVNTEHYEEHPCLSPEAAQWLVDHRVKMVGVDFSTPDLTSHLRPPDFDFPVHYTLLRHGVLVAEHMTNLDALSDKRVEIVFGALNVLESDGAPARVLARTIGPD